MSDISVSIYDGHDRLGSIVQRTIRRFEAFDPSGCHLGTYERLKAAAATLSNTRPVPCVRDISGRGGGG